MVGYISPHFCPERFITQTQWLLTSDTLALIHSKKLTACHWSHTQTKLPATALCPGLITNIKNSVWYHLQQIKELCMHSESCLSALTPTAASIETLVATLTAGGNASMSVMPSPIITILQRRNVWAYKKYEASLVVDQHTDWWISNVSLPMFFQPLPPKPCCGWDSSIHHPYLLCFFFSSSTTLGFPPDLLVGSVASNPSYSPDEGGRVFVF